MITQRNELVYKGSQFLRQRLVLSCLSGKRVRITDIRSNEDNPGVREYEMSLVRLFDQLSNGSKIQVDMTGTGFTFIPGVLLGGTFTHECNPARGIGYYLEPIMMLAPFCKRPINITLKGITHCKGDLSVNQLRYSHLEVLRKFLVIDDNLQLSITMIGLPPVANGIVHFTCPVRKELKPFQWTDFGVVSKIRGQCFTRRVAPVVGNRVVDAVKRHLNKYITDVYFICDNAKGPAPGFGITINSLTTKGTYYSSEAFSVQQFNNTTSDLSFNNNNSNNNKSNSNNGGDTEDSRIKSPEDVGEEAALRLLEEIRRGGCVDSYSQCLVLLFMVLGPKDVSKVVMGPLTTQATSLLRHLRDFFGVTFKIDDYRPGEGLDSDDSDDEEEDGSKKRKLTGADKVILTCVGTGFVNFSKGNI